MEPIRFRPERGRLLCGRAFDQARDEPLNRFETDLVNTVDQGIKMVDDVGAENATSARYLSHEYRREGYSCGDRARRWPHRRISRLLQRCGTPGDHLPWKAIAEALRNVDYEGPIVIEAFTPEVREIARAVSIWRPLAKSQDRWSRMASATCAQCSDTHNRSASFRPRAASATHVLPARAGGHILRLVISNFTCRPSAAGSRGGPCSRTWRSATEASCRRRTCRGRPG